MSLAEIRVTDAVEKTFILGEPVPHFPDHRPPLGQITHPLHCFNLANSEANSHSYSGGGHVYTPVEPSKDGDWIVDFRGIVGVHDHETPIRSAGTGCCAAAARGWAGKS